MGFEQQQKYVKTKFYKVSGTGTAAVEMDIEPSIDKIQITVGALGTTPVAGDNFGITYSVDGVTFRNLTSDGAATTLALNTASALDQVYGLTGVAVKKIRFQAVQYSGDWEMDVVTFDGV